MPAISQTPYGNFAKVYDALFLTATGFKRGIENFLDRLDFELPPQSRILDAGCGTGLLTRYLAKRFPAIEIWASDIDSKMLAVMERQTVREDLNASRIIIVQSDLKNPGETHLFKTRQTLTIPENFFDAILVSGALEHVPLNESLPRLVKLLKPSGTFFNLWVRKNPAGAVLGMIYRFKPYSVAEMRQACERAGLTEIRVIRLAVEDFPANLSRIAILAKKR